MSLRPDIGLTGLPLRIERVEGLVEAFVGGLPRIDGAADLFHVCTPKKRGPDHLVPVISLAIALSDRQVLPFQR